MATKTANSTEGRELILCLLMLFQTTRLKDRGGKEGGGGGKQARFSLISFPSLCGEEKGGGEGKKKEGSGWQRLSLALFITWAPGRGRGGGEEKKKRHAKVETPSIRSRLSHSRRFPFIIQKPLEKKKKERNKGSERGRYHPEAMRAPTLCFFVHHSEMRRKGGERKKKINSLKSCILG